MENDIALTDFAGAFKCSFENMQMQCFEDVEYLIRAKCTLLWNQISTFLLKALILCGLSMALHFFNPFSHQQNVNNSSVFKFEIQMEESKTKISDDSKACYK